MRKIECKIVQNLLPNYIDELTDSEINEFIEKHIENCKECEQALKDMQGDIKLEKINNSKKINALKKIKRRYRRIVIISILAVILIGIISLYCWNNYRFVKDENGKTVIERFTFDKKNISNYKNTVINVKKKQDYTKDGYIYITYFLTVDNNNKCINVRIKMEGYSNDEYLQLEYNEIKIGEEVSKIYGNVKRDEKSIIYNDNTLNGEDKDKFIEKLKLSMEIESIFEY